MKRVLVTGGTGELGGAVAQTFVRQGYEVHVTASRASDPKDGVTRVHAVDLADLDQCKRLAEDVAEVDVLALCAGGFAMSSLSSLTAAHLEEMMQKNFKTAAYVLAAFVPRLQAAGKVVLVGSQAYEGAANMAAYAASKAAVVSLAKSAAAELKERAITVNAVLPDTIDTAANRRAMPNADTSRWATPEELAEVVSWLCSPAARVVSGNAIRVGR